MDITILCSSTNHPIHEYLLLWQNKYGDEHHVEVVTKITFAGGGDILFLISCNDIVCKEVRENYKVSLVIHASDVPEGRGWSPLIWQILEGRSSITVTMMEVENGVDSGLIWAQQVIEFAGHELYDEINEKLFTAELELMDRAIVQFSTVQPYKQPDKEATYYKKRTPEDSEIDPTRSLIESFNALRVADPNRFPAFFYHLGHKYKIKIEKFK